jgi:hypothetical protein
MYPALELEGDWDEYTDLSAGVSGKLLFTFAGLRSIVQYISD